MRRMTQMLRADLGQNLRSADRVMTDAITQKAVARRRNSPRECCTATDFVATTTDSACAESTSQLMVRVTGRSVMAHLGVALRCSKSAAIWPVASSYAGRAFADPYRRRLASWLDAARSFSWCNAFALATSELSLRSAVAMG